MIDFSTSSLKDIRHFLGKTQQELAEMLGYTRNYIAIIESGKPNKFTDKLRQRLKNVVELSTADEKKFNTKKNNIQQECTLCRLKEEENQKLIIKLGQSNSIIESQAKSIEFLSQLLNKSHESHV